MRCWSSNSTHTAEGLSLTKWIKTIEDIRLLHRFPFIPVQFNTLSSKRGFAHKSRKNITLHFSFFFLLPFIIQVLQQNQVCFSFSYFSNKSIFLISWHSFWFLVLLFHLRQRLWPRLDGHQNCRIALSRLHNDVIARLVSIGNRKKRNVRKIKELPTSIHVRGVKIPLFPRVVELE